MAAVNKGVFEMVKVLGSVPSSGRIVRVEESRVWINLGRAAVSVGDQLEATTDREELVDPETGINLGGVTTKLASLRVVEVEEKFSVAEVLSVEDVLTRGDKVTSTSAPPELEFAPAWEQSEYVAF